MHLKDDVILNLQFKQYNSPSPWENLMMHSKTMFTNENGTKHDQGKPAVEFIPMEALFAMGHAYGYGAKKYGGHNFKKGIAVCRCVAAGIRHCIQFLAGENNDPESGHSHLGHALAAIGMAVWMMANRPDMDDRYKPKEE